MLLRLINCRFVTITNILRSVDGLFCVLAFLQICDGAGDPCDDVCGGAGCGKCGGGVSCDEGAVTKATQAVDLSNQSESILVVRKREIEAVFNQVGVSPFRASLKRPVCLQSLVTIFTL